MKLLVLMLVCAIAVTFAIAVNLHSPSTSADDGWIPLLNGKNFDGWYSFTETGGKNNDPTHVFKLEDGAVHILDVGAAGVAGLLPLEEEVFAVGRKERMRVVRDGSRRQQEVRERAGAEDGEAPAPQGFRGEVGHARHMGRRIPVRA